jgi:hypothetical protein
MKDEDTYQALTSRAKFQNFMIPRGANGQLNGRFYLWTMKYNGFTVLFHEMDILINQVVQGAKSVFSSTLANVTEILCLLEQLMKNAPAKVRPLTQLIKRSCLILIDKFIQVPNPPIYLLAGCLRCLSTIKDDDWKALADTGLFPYLSR